MGPGEVKRMISATVSITGLKSTMPTSAPQMSMARFRAALTGSVSGTARILMTGRPSMSSETGLLWMTLR